MSENKKIILKKLLLTALLAAVLFAVLNFNYFYGQAIYVFTGRKEVYRTEGQQSGKEKTQPNQLVVESLQLTAPIVYVQAATEAAFQEGLKSGVVHYPGTARPGQLGNCYIFGHSSDLPWAKGSFKTIFATLPRIAVGDRVEVSDPEGNIYVYVVTGTKIVGPNQVEYLQQDYSKRTLTLQTSYPVGTALKRFLVFAEIGE